MPHAEEVMVNGEKGSKTINHITSYPLVSDSISTIKSNPYAAKSLSAANVLHERFISPALPYAAKPYGYVAPYIERADSIGDSSLQTLDSKFPIVKHETSKIRDTLLSYVNYPFEIFGKSSDHVLDTWGNEYKKCGGDGYVAGGKALVTTGLVITSEGLGWLSNWLSAKKEEGRSMIEENGTAALAYVKDKKEEAEKETKVRKEQAKKDAGY